MKGSLWRCGGDLETGALGATSPDTFLPSESRPPTASTTTPQPPPGTMVPSAPRDEWGLSEPHATGSAAATGSQGCPAFRAQSHWSGAIA